MYRSLLLTHVFCCFTGEGTSLNVYKYVGFYVISLFLVLELPNDEYTVYTLPLTPSANLSVG
jgi:hypothetical protein